MMSFDLKNPSLRTHIKRGGRPYLSAFFVAFFSVSSVQALALTDGRMHQLLEDYDGARYASVKQSCSTWWRRWWSTEMAACTFSRFMTSLEQEHRQEPFDIAALPLDKFAKTRRFIATIDDAMHDPLSIYHVTKPIHIASNLAAVNYLSELYNAYRELPKREIMSHLCKRLKDPAAPVSDVREIELVDALLSDNAFQKKLNDYTASPSYKKWQEAHAECQDLHTFWRKTTFLGVRVPRLAATVQSLRDKDEGLQAARAAGSTYDGGGLNAHEAWLLDHVQIVESQYEALSLVPGLASRLEPYHTIARLESEIRERTLAHLETGDILRQTMHLAREYRGRTDLLEKLMPYALSGDSNHASMVLRQPNADRLRPMVLHTLDSTGKASGTFIQYLTAGEGYYTSAYRYNLDQLIVHEGFRSLVSAEAEAQGMSLRLYLEERARPFRDAISQSLQEDFAPTSPHGEAVPKYLIGNTGGTRFAVIANPVRRALPDLSGQSLYERAQRARAAAQNPRYQEFLARKIASVSVDLKEKESLLQELRQAADAREGDAELIAEGELSLAALKAELASLQRKQAAQQQEQAIGKGPRHAPLRDDEAASNEICSLFALIESVRYLHALEEKFQAAYDLEGQQLFEIPFRSDIQFAAFHPGRLEYELERLERADKIRQLPSPGVFSPSRHWLPGRIKKRLGYLVKP